MSSFTDVIQDIRVTVRSGIWVRRLRLAQVTVYNNDNVGLEAFIQYKSGSLWFHRHAAYYFATAASTNHQWAHASRRGRMALFLQATRRNPRAAVALPARVTCRVIGWTWPEGWELAKTKIKQKVLKPEAWDHILCWLVIFDYTVYFQTLAHFPRKIIIMIALDIKSESKWKKSPVRQARTQ